MDNKAQVALKSKPNDFVRPINITALLNIVGFILGCHFMIKWSPWTFTLARKKLISTTHFFAHVKGISPY